MPSCFKSYEIKYGVDQVYTTKVNKMLLWYRSHGGLLVPGEVNDISTVDMDLESCSDFFLNTLKISTDINPNSTVNKGQEKSCPSRRYQPTGRSTVSVVTESRSTTYPLYNLVADQIKDKVGTNLLCKAMNIALTQIIAHNNKDKQADLNPDAGSNIYSTGQVDSRQVYTRKAPHGSPSRKK